MLPEVIKLAVLHARELRNQGGNYFDRNRANIRAWWRVHAMEMVERDPTLTGVELTKRCQAQYNRAHQTMMEHRAMMNDPAARFPNYFAAIANKPHYKKAARAAN